MDRTGDGTVWLTISAFSRPREVVREGGRTGDAGTPARLCAAVRGGAAAAVRGVRRGLTSPDVAHACGGPARRGAERDTVRGW